jgi:ABC-2 type transport system permease protein
LVLLACALGLGAFLALGYTLAAIYPSATAAIGIGNPLMILLMLTSGAFVPLEVLPPSIRAVMWSSPVRHFADLIQGLWAGQPWSDYWLATAVLVGMLLVLGPFGIKLFRWDPA